MILPNTAKSCSRLFNIHRASSPKWQLVPIPKHLTPSDLNSAVKSISVQDVQVQFKCCSNIVHASRRFSHTSVTPASSQPQCSAGSPHPRPASPAVSEKHAELKRTSLIQMNILSKTFKNAITQSHAKAVRIYSKDLRPIMFNIGAIEFFGLKYSSPTSPNHPNLGSGNPSELAFGIQAICSQHRVSQGCPWQRPEADPGFVSIGQEHYRAYFGKQYWNLDTSLSLY